MPKRSAAQGVFALAVAGLGLVGLSSGGLAYLWQPTPPWALHRPLLAFASGAFLLLSGAGLLWQRSLARSAIVLWLLGVSSMLLVHVPRLAEAPLQEVEWFNLGEVATIVAGAWILFATAAPPPSGFWQRVLGGDRGVRQAHQLFALALPAFGLSHFVYAKTTADMVPAALPGHLAWAYLTGAAHIAAGLAILVGVAPRLAARLEGLMIGIFLLAVNVPDLVASGGRQQWQWTELFVASAIAAVSFLVARSDRPTR